MQRKKNPLTRLVPILVVAVALAIVFTLLTTTPQPEKRATGSESRISVEVVEVQSVATTPMVLSYGMVEPRVRSSLVAQVGGKVDEVSERFRDGGFFREGEVLLQIDAIDYEIQVEVAEANLAEAEQRLAIELAQVLQAKTDWARSGRASSARPLVLREPQLKAAEANVSSAKALLKRAQLNLDRTTIRAPFDGRVLSTSVDLGQVVSANAALGEIYATDAVEIRLPIKNDDLPLLNLPEDYRLLESSAQELPAVSIRSELGKEEVWQGSIVRTAGSIEDSSRQLYVVARIVDPFGEQAEGRFPLKIGQYVTAEIEGVSLESAISIPNKAIYQGSYVYLHRGGEVHRTLIDIAWQNQDIAIIAGGISAGDQLVVSPLGQVVSGTLVEVVRERSAAAGHASGDAPEDHSGYDPARPAQQPAQSNGNES